MIKRFPKLVALTLVAGAFFIFCCGFSTRLPKGVFVNGTDVGGLTRRGAERVLRESTENTLKGVELRICADEFVYTYTFPEIYYQDNLSEGLAKITRPGRYFSDIRYYLNGAEEIVGAIADDCDKQVEEPYASFSAEGEPFDYREGRDGVRCDRAGLLADIEASLNGGFYPVTARLESVPRTETIKDIEERTRKLYSFTTYFDGSNSDRSANIRLAASKINGSVLGAGEVFSFNATVGKRTADNGFKPAKIIENGRFVTGVGGGVCQVSTTLYNAALLAGLSIEEYHPHSLAVSYVAPSRDAMVSGNYCDLKFRNCSEYPVYIRAKAGLNYITCSVYGKSDGWKYSLVSEVTATVPRPPAQIVEGEENKTVVYGRDGTESCGWLVKKRAEQCERTLIRRDKYAAVGGVEQIARQKEGEAEGNDG